MAFRHLAARTLPWNGSPAARFQPAGLEQVARGPSAVCLDSDGRPMVLNSLSQTLVRMDPGFQRQAVIATPAPDFDDLTCAEQSLVLFSPLRSQALVLSRDGRRLARITVPRAIRRPLSVDLMQGDLWLTTALQERWQVSRSLESLSLPAIQQTKREGFPLAGGKALQVLVRNRRPQLLILDGDEGGKSRLSNRILSRLSLPGYRDSLRPLWSQGRLVCLLAETMRQDDTGTMHASRSVECVDIHSGVTKASLDLPPPGGYAPKHWLAMRDGILVIMLPQNTGLHMDLWKLEVTR